jgi:hypothetical protein
MTKGKHGNDEKERGNDITARGMAEEEYVWIPAFPRNMRFACRSVAGITEECGKQAQLSFIICNRCGSDK